MIKCNLQKVLEEAHVTPKQLESKTHLSHATIRHLLDGSAHDIHFDVLEALCVFLKCDIGDLLSLHVEE